MALRDRITQEQDNALELELAGLTPTARASASVWQTKATPTLTLYYDTRSGTVTHAVTIAPDGTTTRTQRPKGNH